MPKYNIEWLDNDSNILADTAIEEPNLPMALRNVLQASQREDGMGATQVNVRLADAC